MSIKNMPSGARVKHSTENPNAIPNLSWRKKIKIGTTTSTVDAAGYAYVRWDTVICIKPDDRFYVSNTYSGYVSLAHINYLTPISEEEEALLLLSTIGN